MGGFKNPRNFRNSDAGFSTTRIKTKAREGHWDLQPQQTSKVLSNETKALFTLSTAEAVLN